MLKERDEEKVSAYFYLNVPFAYSVFIYVLVYMNFCMLFIILDCRSDTCI